MRRAFLRGSVEEHEVRHRRRVLVLTGILTLIAISPVLGHHLSGRLGDALAGRDHVWIVCLVALHELLGPVHALFHVMLFLGISYAIADRTRAWASTWRTLRMIAVRRATRADIVWHAATLVDVPHDVLRIADALPNPAFTAGWFRPSIYVDRRLETRLTLEQLGAVLAHEYAHVRRRDPARLTFLRALGCVLFWLPALRRLAADVADDAEIAADDFAVRGDPLVLASAILRLAQWGRDTGSIALAGPDALNGGHGVVGFQRDEMLDRRIHRLLGDDARIVTHVTLPSLMSAAAGLFLAWSSGMAVAHPMSAAGEHCAHQHALAIEHLFCRAGHTGPREPFCPHEHVAAR